MLRKFFLDVYLIIFIKFKVKDMKLGVITPNIFFGESLKSLIESYGFTKERYITLKDVNSKNIEQLDVIISDKRSDSSPINNIYLNRPFRFSELVEALHLVFERLKNKRDNKRVFGDISFIMPDRKLIYNNDQSVELTEKESDIILSLLSSSYRGITKEDVMSKVWMLNANMETHTFETHLYRLRKKIKENLFLENLIMNKGGRYYLNRELTGQKN